MHRSDARHLSGTASGDCRHCSVLSSARDAEQENRPKMSGLRMSLLSTALILFLVAILILWELLPSHYLWNYLAGVTIWLLSIGIPVTALVALVLSILDLLRIGGTDGRLAAKGSAVVGLLLSIIILTLCVFFLLAFNAPDSSQMKGESTKRTFHRKDAKYARKEDESHRVHRKYREEH